MTEAMPLVQQILAGYAQHGEAFDVSTITLPSDLVGSEAETTSRNKSATEIQQAFVWHDSPTATASGLPPTAPSTDLYRGGESQRSSRRPADKPAPVSDLFRGETHQPMSSRRRSSLAQPSGNTVADLLR